MQAKTAATARRSGSSAGGQAAQRTAAAAHVAASGRAAVPISTRAAGTKAAAAPGSDVQAALQQQQQQQQQPPPEQQGGRRQLLAAGAVLLGAAGAAAAQPRPALADTDTNDFTTTPSGLSYLDIRVGEGAKPAPGDTIEIHWSGYTKGYQGKRIDNTSVRDEPYEFVLGGEQTIPAFQEAVSTMKIGGIRRIEVPGAHPELSYPRDRSLRFTNELLSADGKVFKYRYGPQPAELGGQRALDFVLDNPTLQDFNRTLLFDIKLLNVRKSRRTAQ